MKRLLIIPTTCLFLASTAMAANDNPHYMSLSYINSDMEYAGSDLSGSGVGLSGALALNSGLSLLAGFETVDFDSDLTAREYSFGAGYRMEVLSGVTLGARYKYLKTKLSGEGKSNASGNQFAGELQVEIPDWMISFGKKRLVEAYAGQTQYSNDDINEVGVGMRIYLTESFSLGASYAQEGDDRSDFQIFIREDR